MLGLGFELAGIINAEHRNIRICDRNIKAFPDFLPPVAKKSGKNKNPNSNKIKMKTRMHTSFHLFSNVET